jgi:hypothetical protein
MSAFNNGHAPTPHAIEAERAILATVLLDPRALEDVRPMLSRHHFFFPEHEQVYAAMLELSGKGEDFDSPILAGKLREMLGISEQDAALRVAQLMDGAYRVSNVEIYARQVIESYKRRSILRALPDVEKLLRSGAALEDVGVFLRGECDKLADGERRKLKELRADELLELIIPPREMLLTPILPTQSLSMLYAKRGIGKTFLALGISHAVASGTKFLKWEALSPNRVVYVDGELPGRLLQERYRMISGGSPSQNLGFISPDFQEGSIPDLASQEGQALIESHLKDVRLLVLDNLSCLVRGVKENEGEGWLPIQGWALGLRRQGISVLFLHHAGKQGTQRGTSRREDVLDTSLTLRNPSDYRAEEGLRVELHFEKCRSLTGEDVRPFEVKLETWAEAADWTTRDIEDAKKSRVLALLEEDSATEKWLLK